MTTISAKELRAHLRSVVSKVKHGESFTVLYRSRQAFAIVPVGHGTVRECPLELDSLYGAQPVGKSSSGTAARSHDEVLYRRSSADTEEHANRAWETCLRAGSRGRCAGR